MVHVQLAFGGLCIKLEITPTMYLSLLMLQDFSAGKQAAVISSYDDM